MPLLPPFLPAIIEDTDDSNDDDDSDLVGRAVQAYLKMQAERRPAVPPADDQSDADDEDSDDSDLAAKAVIAFSQLQSAPQPMGQAAEPSPSQNDSLMSEVLTESSPQSETESDDDLASRAAQLYHTALADIATNPAAETSPTDTDMDVDLAGFSLKVPTGVYTADHFASVPDEWIM